MAATEATPRVALLARAGEACDRISGALREAGAEVVLVADPLQADPGDVRGATPEAILVALDPAIEDAIDRYADVLADPGYMVIFEEAEQAALRTGWDAARWLRHLSAKLHRHQNVLPAGAGVDDEMLLTPGVPSPPRAEVDLDEAIVAFTDEAQQRADDVPRDNGLADLTGLAVDPADEIMLADEAGEPTLDDAILSFGEVAAEDAGESQDLAYASDLAVAGDNDEGMAGTLLAFEAEDDGITLDFDEPVFDAARFDRAGQVHDASEGIDAFLAARSEPAADDDVVASAEAAGAAEGDRPSVSMDLSGLSLADDHAPLQVEGTVEAATPEFDLGALGGGLSLADPDSYGHGPLRGVVLIEAGLGGPDAVRQLLAAIPEGFPRSILIRLQLEGGRYDRLVKQMTRATPAPVAVAEDGQPLEPGSIYFLPPGLGLKAVASRWVVDAGVAFDPESSLPAQDSAVLFLSGADAGLVPRLTGGRWPGGLVLGQTPGEGCYEPAAAQAAIAAGAAHAAPVVLATMLLDRWPPPGHGASEDTNGMLQP